MVIVEIAVGAAPRPAQGEYPVQQSGAKRAGQMMAPGAPVQARAADSARAVLQGADIDPQP